MLLMGRRQQQVFVVSPQWTRAELEDIVQGDADRGLITQEQADRMIADGRRQLKPDGTPR